MTKEPLHPGYNFEQNSSGTSDIIARLKKRVKDLERQEIERDYASTKEKQLHSRNPGLKELWDQYQTMLQLVNK